MRLAPILNRIRAISTAASPAALDAQERRSLTLFVLIFVALIGGTVVAAYASYVNYERQFRAQVERQLTAIIELKVGELTSWRAERLADAEVLRQNSAFAELARRFLDDPRDLQAEQRLREWLDSLYRAYRYDRVYLLDGAGVERLAVPQTGELAPSHLAPDAMTALASGEVVFLDFHQKPDERTIHLALLAPLYAGQDRRQPVGVVVLSIDPEISLYPYLQRWPTSSATAETLLVRREGEQVLFLSPLRFRPDAALHLRIPLQNTDVLAVKAVLGQRGIVEGLDYRGRPVIGAVQAIPDSPWFLVARMDTAEAYGPLRQRLRETVAFFGVLVAATGAGLGMLWRRQRLHYYRRQVEAAHALRASEERFRSVVNSMNDIVYTLDREQRHTGVYGPWVARNGLTPEFFLGKSARDLFGAEAATVHEEANRRALAGEYVIYDWSASSTDGTRYFQTSLSPLHDATGAIVGIVGVGREVTERRRQEQELLAAQAELQRLLADADRSRRVLLSVIEDQRAAEGALRENNRRLLILHQVGLALAQTHDLPTIYRIAREHVLQLVDCPCFGISLYDPATRTLRAEYMISDGIVLDSQRFPPLVFAEDLPLRGRARALLAQQPEIVTDMLAGPSAEAVVVGVPGDERAPRSALYMPMVVHGQTIGLLELQSYREDAYAETDLALLAPLANQVGLAIENARLFKQLQAERNSLAQRVAERTAQLEVANRELEAFSYSVSHDLRAPLRAMEGFSSALLSRYREQLDDQGRHYLERIQNAAQRMGQLINDLLDLSRVTRRELVRQSVDLSALAQEIAAELRARDPQRQVRFVIAQPLCVEGDASLLRIALQNLLENAWKFSVHRKVACIEVGQTTPDELRASPAGVPHVVADSRAPIYFVRDNGVGFDMAYADKLFAPFQRLHGMNEFPGSGIGLAIVQRIISRHGGVIWPYAQMEHGATFYFTLGEAS